MNITEAYRKKEKSESIFEDSLIRLLKIKNFHRITIVDITKESGLSRSTFYNYYNDPLDLLESVIDKTIYQFYEDTHASIEDPILDNIEESSLNTLDFFEKNKELIRVLTHDEVRPILLSKWLNLIKGRAESKPERYLPKGLSKEYADIFQVFWFNGMWALFAKMLNSNKDFTTEDYHKVFAFLVQRIF